MTKNLFVALFGALLLTSCVTTQKPLYTWDKYGDATYAYVKEPNEKTIEELIAVYENIIYKQNGSRQVPPPGIYADYGYLLLQANKVEEGKAMLQKEIETYPESKVFVERILKMAEGNAN